MGDDENEAPNIFESDGLILTAIDNRPGDHDLPIVQVNTQGNGLGIDSDTGSNDPRDIEGALTEYLEIEFPPATTLNELNIDVKHTGSDLISITLYDSNGDVIDPSTATIVFTSDVIGTLSTSNGSISSEGYINGDMLGQGGDTITITSNVAFASLKIVDENDTGSGGTDGFSVLNVYGTVSSTPDSYDSILHVNGLGLGDTDGSEEISTVTFSDFPTGSFITLGSDTIYADLNGNWVIDAAILGLDPDLSSLNDIDMILTSPIAISTSFVPTVDILTSESEPVPDAHTILGGTADSTLVGDAGDDYIDGGTGSDTINTGAGNDTIVYDTVDTIDGGDGVDTLIISVSDGDILDLGTVDLSNVSNINNIHVQLEGNATVIGSSIEEPLNHITPADVIDLTISDNNTLIIHSADGDDASGQVDVHTSFGTASAYVGGDITGLGDIGVDYAHYSDSGATLLIEVDIPIDVV
jgi:hypothetical protein